MIARDRVLAVGLVGVAVVAAATLSTQTSGRVSVLLDENWRGGYDILVTSGGDSFGQGETDGLVDPAFISTAGAGGITSEQLEQVRAIDGVDVAAPIGMVGVLRNTSLAPALWVASAEAGIGGLGPGSVVASVSMTIEDTRSATQAAIARHTGTVVLPDPDRFDPMQVPGAATPVGFGPMTTDSGFYVPMGNLPEFSSPVIAIDPQAEIALLGSQQGAALAALSDLPNERGAASSGQEWAELVDPGAFLSSWNDLLNADELESTAVVVPLVVAEPEPGTLRMRVQVEARTVELDEIPRDPGQIQALAAGTDLDVVDPIEVDASFVVAPFSSAALTVSWPGDASSDDAAGFFNPATTVTPALVGRPAYDPVDAPPDLSPSTPSFRVQPRGVVDAAGLPLDAGALALAGAQAGVGEVQSYRELHATSGAHAGGTTAAPVGTFVASQLDDTDADALSYVPSGLQPVQTRTLAGDQPVWANFSSLDFITASAGAFTDLAGGAALRGHAPIDAVRVRVAGLQGYEEQGRQHVAAVASQIAGLGLSVTVVAGSSPTQVAIDVPEHQVHADGSATDLGWTVQDWTSLGAAVSVQSGITASTGALVAMTMAAAGLGLVITTVQNARGRRDEVQVLRLIGWREATIRRRLLAGEIPTVLLVTAIATACLPWAAPEVRAPIIALTATAWAASVLAPLVARTRPRVRAPHGRSTAPLTTLAAWAWRRVGATPITWALTATGALLLPLLIGLGVGATSTHLASIGASRLANAAGDLTLASIWALGLTGAGVGLMLIAASRRIEMRQRARTEHVLTQLGLTARTRRSLLRREDLILGASTLLIGALVVTGLAATDLPEPAVIAAGAGTLLALAARLPTYTRGTR